jgi:hypothetical protein
LEDDPYSYNITGCYYIYRSRLRARPNGEITFDHSVAYSG